MNQVQQDKGLKILVVGHGEMGKLVAEVAEARCHRIAGFVSRSGAGDWRDVAGALSAAPADVAIDFTHAAAIEAVVQACIDAEVPLVTGTTGWTDRESEIARRVESGGGTLLHEANFSVGMQLFMRTVEAACRLYGNDSVYDIALEERHHRSKSDAPSGTALEIARRIVATASTKRTIGNPGDTGSPAADELRVTATRIGTEFGSHAVIFDAEEDIVVLRHTARGRRGFALGAVRAAEWLVGWPSPGSRRLGLFKLDDMIADVAGGGDDGGRRLG